MPKDQSVKIEKGHYGDGTAKERTWTMTVDDLETRAKRGNREKLLAVLAKAPDVEPEQDDKL